MSTSDEKTQRQQIRDEPVAGSARAAEPMPVADSAEPPSRATSASQAGSRPDTKNATHSSGVYFFPEETVTEAEVRKLLASDSPKDRARVVGHLLTYAEYDEIWTWVDRDTVRELFESLTLPERLRAAWARNLGWVAKVD